MACHPYLTSLSEETRARGTYLIKSRRHARVVRNQVSG